ncbi:hypothetical protein [Cylindrospermum sp. FACHB-282]|nr:hypothetical protein [Cylindrospermum sp. FACHB-282]MBD2388128.1 hypothetical protein [Cylindrospermum sp. FACHB-282]
MALLTSDAAIHEYTALCGPPEQKKSPQIDTPRVFRPGMLGDRYFA